MTHLFREVRFSCHRQEVQSKKPPMWEAFIVVFRIRVFLDVEQEVHYVSILDHVFLSFGGEFTDGPYSGF